MRRDLTRLASETFDLAVVGGGVHGLAAAWDAAQRGLSVALVEKGDFCGATSSNSLKTIHGGLRYLQQADFRRMRHSIRERRALLRIAPHVTRPLAFVMPTRRRLTRSRLAMRAALCVNDLVSWDRNRGLDDAHALGRGRLLSRDELLALVPGLVDGEATGGALWWDAQMTNTERLALSFLRSAVDAGAAAANYVEARAVRPDRIAVTDGPTGDAFDVRARCVLDARGPWTGARLSRAMNLVLNRSLTREHAVGIGEGGGRLLFLVPWRDVTMIGTTHLPYDGAADDYRPTAADVDAFLADVNRAHPAADLYRTDVAFVHAGLLPATGAVANGEAELLRHHRVRVEPDGVVTMLGVKWTTARGVAEEAVDLVVARLGATVRPCATATTPLHHLAHDELRPFLEEAPDALAATTPVRAGEVLHAIREEMALTLADVVFRRTELGSAGDPGGGALEACAGVAAAELGWDDARKRDEIAAVWNRWHYFRQ